MKNFGKSVISLPFFSSNILFLRWTGYFAEPAETIPLLHTWSLAVEEQFYVIFPGLLIIISKFAQSRFKIFFAVIAVSSLGLSIWMESHVPAANFYLAPTRAWELMLGALTAVGAWPPIGSKPLREMLAAAGIGLIIWSAVTYSSMTPFPGLAAIPPVLGTAFIICAGASGSTRLNVALSTSPCVFLGAISYSLYLWHWPILVFGQLSTSLPLSWTDKIILLALTVVLAVITFHFVEQPFRKRKIFTGIKPLMASAGITAMAFCVFGLVVVRGEGIPQRIDSSVRDEVLANSWVKASWAYPTKCTSNYRTRFSSNDSIAYCLASGAQAKTTVLFWGDFLDRAIFSHRYRGSQSGDNRWHERHFRHVGRLSTGSYDQQSRYRL